MMVFLINFVEFAPARLALLAHPNKGYSKLLNYKEVRLKIRPVSVFKSFLNFRLMHDSAADLFISLLVY